MPAPVKIVLSLLSLPRSPFRSVAGENKSLYESRFSPPPLLSLSILADDLSLSILDSDAPPTTSPPPPPPPPTPSRDSDAPDSSWLPPTPPTPPPPRHPLATSTRPTQVGCLRRLRRPRRRLRLRPDALSPLRRPRLRRRRPPPPLPPPTPFPPPPKPRPIVRLGTLLISHSVIVSVICCIAGVLALLLLLILTKNTYIPVTHAMRSLRSVKCLAASIKWSWLNYLPGRQLGL
ncbi:WAS/WASL-interacting protein family member 3-like [Eucalyptus grandis]|uniref:WAS/WASL-interacting protein family member 3-like n=1 Tax=Eucalyptus grandis TaxID=71139 RepID=UPI00192F02F7|nr:WAS/WASL-interacting protein family member 3-like [Eucalyptus grandis]